MSSLTSEYSNSNFPDEARNRLFNPLTWKPNLDFPCITGKEYYELRTKISQANQKLLQILVYRKGENSLPTPSPLLMRALSKTSGVTECIFPDVVDPDGVNVTYDILTGGPEIKATLIVEYLHAADLIGLHTASESLIRRDQEGNWKGFFEGWRDKSMNGTMIDRLLGHVNNLWTIAEMPDEI